MIRIYFCHSAANFYQLRWKLLCRLQVKEFHGHNATVSSAGTLGAVLLGIASFNNKCYQ